MLLIGICDGDTAVRVMLSDFIKRYKDETGLNIQVLIFGVSHGTMTVDVYLMLYAMGQSISEIANVQYKVRRFGSLRSN